VAKLSRAKAERKALGEFYTAEPVAKYLVDWALRQPTDSILDPSFGGGVFLQAAAERLRQLGGSIDNIHGVEIAEAAYNRVALSFDFAQDRTIGEARLHRADFLALTPGQLGLFDSVVGNPPFIRAPRLSAASRSLALSQAAAQGVRLSKRSSVWAPFLVHASAFVKPGGRMAMVVPAELGHAVYARAVIEHLTQSFAQVTLLSPRERLFPELDQDTLLLLAEGRTSLPRQALPHKGWDGASLRSGRGVVVGQWLDQALTVASGEWRVAISKPCAQVAGSPDDYLPANSSSRLVGALLPERVLALYQELAVQPRVRRLGALAEVGIGYVTGANRFFHLSPAEVARWELPPEALRPAVWRSRALVGLRLSRQDWQRACASGTAGYLLQVNGDPLKPCAQVAGSPDNSEAVWRYLAHGEASGVAQGYKARERRCWYQVGNVKVPDLLLAAMGLRLALVTNEANVTVPNTLHVVRLYPHAQTTALDLSLGWQSTLTRLSLEVEGHALGGGLLKLEPSEARRVLVALPDPSPVLSEAEGEARMTFDELEPELDQLLRQRRFSEARELADQAILQGGLGLTQRECRLLREGYRLLCERRLKRAAAFS